MILRSGFSVLLIIFITTANAQASFLPSYFQKFKDQEVYVTVVTDKCKPREILLYVEEVDVANHVVVGRSNEGRKHIDTENVVLIREQQPGQHGVFNR